MTKLEAGQIWKDNDDRGVGYERYVEIVKVGLTLVTIKNRPPLKRRTSSTDKKRFGLPGKSGFTYVCNVEPRKVVSGEGR